jgi:hypothetical protein
VGSIGFTLVSPRLENAAAEDGNERLASARRILELLAT